MKWIANVQTESKRLMLVIVCVSELWCHNFNVLYLLAEFLSRKLNPIAKPRFVCMLVTVTYKKLE
jgi:hypothetical protein